jgi:predicted transcriptional regulator
VEGVAADLHFPPAMAAALPVGLAMARSVVCVCDGLRLADVVRDPCLRECSSAVPVVNHERSLVGMLPLDAIDAAANRPHDRFAFVSDRMTSSVSVHEGDRLGDAFSIMAGSRLRVVTVVGDGRRVVGMLRDVDAMHFVAHVARTGTRPPASKTDRTSPGF